MKAFVQVTNGPFGASLSAEKIGKKARLGLGLDLTLHGGKKVFI